MASANTQTRRNRRPAKKTRDAVSRLLAALEKSIEAADEAKAARDELARIGQQQQGAKS